MLKTWTKLLLDKVNLFLWCCLSELSDMCLDARPSFIGYFYKLDCFLFFIFNCKFICSSSFEKVKKSQAELLAATHNLNSCLDYPDSCCCQL